MMTSPSTADDKHMWAGRNSTIFSRSELKRPGWTATERPALDRAKEGAQHRIGVSPALV